MAFRNVGLSLRNYTTTQVASLVTRFGPTGTQEANAIKPGTLIWNSTTAAVQEYNGTTFVNVKTQ